MKRWLTTSADTQHPCPPDALPSTLYLGIDGSGIPVRPEELAGRAGKQPDGKAKTREGKLVIVWSAESCDEEGFPVRDPGSITYSAAIESAAQRDTDEHPSEFAERVRREGTRRRFTEAIRNVPHSPWCRHFSAMSRLIKSPKLYFTDSGLAAYLANARQAKSGETIYGALWETWAMQNFASILEAHLPDTRLSYWHEQGRHEVDLVVESGRKVFAFEIKATVRWSESDLRGLRAFAERTPTCAAAILAYNGTKTVSLGNKIWAVPLGALVQ